MNPSQSINTHGVPNIIIRDADSALLDSAALSMEFYDLDPSPFPCSSEFVSNDSSCLSALDELPHLSTTNQPYFTGFALSLPYLGETSMPDGGLSPSLGSPTPSFTSSLSPSSIYDPLPLSDTDTPFTPSPTTPDHQFLWPLPGPNHSSGSLDSDSFVDTIGFLDAELHPQRPRSFSSPTSRRGPVASKAMIEANGRRRRHPAQFECSECRQTFTAQFSLKRHMQSHTGERPYVCNVPGCQQRFFNSSDCKRHEKSKKRHKDLVMQ